MREEGDVARRSFHCRNVVDDDREEEKGATKRNRAMEQSAVVEGGKEGRKEGRSVGRSRLQVLRNGVDGGKCARRFLTVKTSQAKFSRGSQLFSPRFVAKSEFARSAFSFRSIGSRLTKLVAV